MTAKPKPAHYVDNKLLYQVMKEYIDAVNEAERTGKEKPRIPKYVGECIVKISIRLASRPNFYNYSYKDDMIADGIETCCRYLHNFSTEKSQNPFSYFTQIIYYSFLQRIAKEKKQAYVKSKAMETYSIMNMLVDQPFSDDHFTLPDSIAKTIPGDKIKDYEDTMNAKKKMKLKPAKGLDKFIPVEEEEEDYGS